MIDPVLAFTEGGPFAWSVPLGAGLATVVATALFVMGMINRRPPAALWLLIPFLTLLVAVFGTNYGFQRTLAAAGTAGPEMQPRILANGRAVSLFVEYLGALSLGPLLLLSTWASGAGGWFAAHQPEPTTRDAAAVGGIAATTLVVGSLTGMVLGPEFSVSAAPLVAFAAGAPAVVLAASRRGTGELASTNVEQRIGSSVLLFFACALSALAVQRAGVIDVLMAMAKASEETRPVLIEAGLGQLQMVWTQIALIAIGCLAMTGWMLQTDREHIDNRTGISLVLAALFAVLWIGAMAVVHGGAPPVEWPGG